MRRCPRSTRWSTTSSMPAASSLRTASALARPSALAPTTTTGRSPTASASRARSGTDPTTSRPSTRRSRRAPTTPTSSSGRPAAPEGSTALVSRVVSRASSSAWPTASTTSIDQGLRRSAASTPTVPDRTADSDRAAQLVRYPSSAAACWTRRRLSSRTSGSPRMTSDTSDLETPARSATSRMVGRRGGPATGSAMAGPRGRRGLATEAGPRDGRDLLPAAVGGRALRRGHHLGRRQGVVDRAGLAPAAGHGHEELLGLDDLEVVVAHGDPRARLEAAVVAQVGVAEHGGIALVGATAAQAHPQLVHLLEVPGQRAVGAVDLEPEAALGADDGPRRLQGADGPRPLGVAGEPDQGGRVVLVLDRAQLAVLDDREVGGRAHGQDWPLGVDGAGQGRDLGDRADDVLHQVDHVAEQVAEGAAAGQLPLEPPRQRPLGLGRVPGEEHRPDVGDAAQGAGGDQLPAVLDGRGVAVVVADGGDQPGRAGRGGDRRRLLHRP